MKEFTFSQRDEFSRQPIADKVISLLISEIDISPMVIDGGWGTGKTEFCHKLINLMDEAKKHHLIYVDAFQADHADEPLLTVLAEIVKVLPTEDKKNFMQKALPVAKYGIKAIGKATVAHLLRQDATEIVDCFDKEIQKVADTAIDAAVESTLKAHVEADKNLKALQVALKDIADTKPIVLFVDELDRCRPDFAVNMLEIIKHTFDVEGVQFVLITNTQQLKAAINHCYGAEVIAQRYLDKFIKFTFSLSKNVQIDRFKEIDASKKHFSSLVTNSPLLKGTSLSDVKNSALSLITRCIEFNELSLREVERLTRYLEIYQTLTDCSLNNNGQLNNNSTTFNLIRLYAICLTSILPETVNNIFSSGADAKSLTALIGITKLPSFEEQPPQIYAHDMIATLLAQECQLNISDYYPSDAVKERFNEEKKIYFQGDFPPDTGDLIKTLKTTLKTLSLAV